MLCIDDIERRIDDLFKVEAHRISVPALKNIGLEIDPSERLDIDARLAH
jgi:hypothetical protein